MSISILRAAQRLPTSWKNGGGVTREVAAWPPGSGLENFQWRASMAEVERDCRFSVFPGVDRTLAILEGKLVLKIAGDDDRRLTSLSSPVLFRGEAETHATVEEGRVTDLNLMVQRGWGRAGLRRLSVSGRQEIAERASSVLVIATGGPLRVTSAGGAWELGLYDAALAQAPETDLWLEAPQPVTAHVATIQNFQDDGCR